MPVAKGFVNIQQSRVLEEGWKCRQTDCIASDGDGLQRQESIGLASCQFGRDLVNIQQSRVLEGLENVGKRTPLDPTETGCCGKIPSDSLRVSSQETDTAKYSSERGGKCRQAGSIRSDRDGLN